MKPYIALPLPCLGPLAPRGALGARHDGLPRQFSPLLPVVTFIVSALKICGAELP